MRRWVAILVALLAGSVAAESEQAIRFQGEALVLRTPEGLSRRFIEHEQLKGLWVGQLGESDVRVEVRMFTGERFAMTEPEQVTHLMARNRKFRYDSRAVVEGPFGRAPFAAFAAARVGTGEVLVLGGLLQHSAYSITVEATPKLADKDRTAVLEFLQKGVEADCPACDPKWTDEEAQARWEQFAPDAATRKSLRKIRRTKHYIIFTNSSGGALFARKMEEFYKKIQKVFPFPEVKGRRLLPVFLFKTREEYMRFSQFVTKMPLPQAAASKGHAYKDYYATYYESPNDPVHIHEATHQIFTNRLHLSAGGSWFQEGVAEYMSANKNQRRSWARNAVKRKRYQPFSSFVKVPTLITNQSLDGKSSYLQAASLVAFLRENRKHKAKFGAFVRRVGGGDDLEEIVRELYDTDLTGLEAMWAKAARR